MSSQKQPRIAIRPFHTIAVLIVAALLATSVTSAQQHPMANRLTLDLYTRVEGVGSPSISPNGTTILYTRSFVDMQNDGRRSELWMMNADGTRKRKLMDGGSPSWSPDGSRIAYVTQGEPSGAQIFVRWMDDSSSEPSQITNLTESPGSIRWSPDSSQIAFTMLVPPTQEEWKIDIPVAKPEDAKWTEAPNIVEKAVYRRDRRGFIDDGNTHIFVVPADGGTHRQISEGNYNFGSPRWNPDGSTLYFSGLLEEDAEYQWRESDVYAMDVETGVSTRLTDHRGPDSGPVPSPDGSLIVFTGNDYTEQTYIEREMYLMNADGSERRSLTPNLDRSPNIIDWAPDSSGVYFAVSEHGTRNLYFAPLNGEPRKLTDGNHQLTVTDITEGGIAVGTLTSYHQPAEIVTFNLNDPANITFLTDHNGPLFADLELGEVEEIWYKSVNDFDIQGWVIKPPNFDSSRKYPLMLSIHGGPHGMYGVGFNFGWQNHAANDYVVLYTNPRGSSGYGTNFGNAINRAYPGNDFDDLMNGVDTVIANGYIDESNMYVYGCSGGGVLTAWVVGHTDRFSAASSNCPVINWLSFVGTTDGISWYRNFDNLPWEDAGEHLRRSPLMYVGNVTTPTMLMTGINDLRTPMSQTEEFYAALKVLRVPTAMIRFNDEWHGTTSNPSNFLRTQLYLRHWFELHMTDDAAPKQLQQTMEKESGQQ
ncbi:MAG: peptidase S9 [Acidobacteria bacterium]|jgi:dipeptidyl aminopeptidase/acylaminoacyl peptidase|nr:peptidase S9 [Acidobacteriota bacterium]|tara:strand:+ start:775 stop:2880 length:2106 start_codon:yes stop_codon:yes gene_type:complete